MELSYSLKTHLHTKKFKREKFMFNSSNCDRKSKLLKLLDQTVRSSEETWENVFIMSLENKSRKIVETSKNLYF